MTQTFQDAAYNHLLNTGAIDAHHHMPGWSQRRQRNPGIWDWLTESYLFFGCVTSAGFVMPAGDVDVAGRIECLLSYLRLTRATTHYRVARLGLLECFGLDLDLLSTVNWREFDEAVRATNSDPEWFEKTLGKKPNWQGGVLDMQVGGTLVDAMSPGVWDWYDYILHIRPTRDNAAVEARTKTRTTDGHNSKCSVKIDSLLYGHLQSARGELRQLFGGEPEAIETLGEYEAYVDQVIREAAAEPNKVALKSAIAGVRRIEFPVTPREKAEKVFSTPLDQLTPENVADFENYIMHFICGKAGESGLPIQLHTGVAPGGYVTDMDNNPGLLTHLILRNPGTNFDIMHGGYPHWGVCSSLAARFPNVYLNMAWMTLISDEGSKSALDLWIDQAPMNKVLWGGDCVFAEETVGAYLVSRDQVIDVLAKRVQSGRMSRELALEYLERVFRRNAEELFSLGTTNSCSGPQSNLPPKTFSRAAVY